MKECPNCGSSDMMWNSEDSDGVLWWYCLNSQCIELHPPDDHVVDEDVAVIVDGGEEE